MIVRAVFHFTVLFACVSQHVRRLEHRVNVALAKVSGAVVCLGHAQSRA